jgi:hypothetical protein
LIWLERCDFACHPGEAAQAAATEPGNIPLKTVAGNGLSLVHNQQGQLELLNTLKQGVGQGMAGLRFKAGRQLNDNLRTEPRLGCVHPDEGGTSHGEGAGFIEKHGT